MRSIFVAASVGFSSLTTISFSSTREYPFFSAGTRFRRILTPSSSLQSCRIECSEYARAFWIGCGVKKSWAWTSKGRDDVVASRTPAITS
ncbi:hypothetical protein BJX62DRAFT_153189 [Aspergillus germanicus]